MFGWLLGGITAILLLASLIARVPRHWWWLRACEFPRRGRGMFSTFHAQHALLRWPLDHVFTSKQFTLRRMQRLPRFGSDHFPILTTLCYRPSRADEHDNPTATVEEHRDARDTVAEAKEREQHD